MNHPLFALGLGLLLGSPLRADDLARGLQLLQENRFAEAAAAFRAAAEARPSDPRVHYNLALALWRAGDAAGAEIAAEKAATLSDGKLVPLRDGILGNLKVEEARGKLAGEAPDLQAALAAAQRARDHFLHGAARPDAPAELTRNLERALQLIAEIEKKIAEQEEQQKGDEQQKPDDQKGEGKDEQQKEGGEQKEEQKEQEGDQKEQEKQQEKEEQQGKEGEQAQDEKGEQKPQREPPAGKPEDKPTEPKPQPEPDPKSQDASKEPKPGAGEEQKPEPKPGAEAAEPPPAGEAREGEAEPPPAARQLTPEETKRLLDVLARLQAEQAELEKARAAARPKVKKDW